MTGAFLFDLDGTLIETDDMHAAVFAEIGGRHGVQIDRARYDREIHGRLNQDIFGDLFPAEDPHAMADEKEARFRERLGDTAEPMPGLARLLDWAADRRLPMAIVTNAPRANADAMLAAIGLTGRFGTIIAAGDVPRGKPDPMPYAEAARRLGVDAGDAVVFEDSPSGVRSGAGAGATVVGIRSSLDDAGLRAAGAAFSIADYNDPALWAHLEREPA
jgi:HAD superfamily hydrolase (TIGR01509 family)